MEAQSLGASAAHIASRKVPVLLLKTKSTPSDAYEEILAGQEHLKGSAGRSFDPRFVPVLLHRFDNGAMQRVRSLLELNQISNEPDRKYGGMIFTSQRAVEAFAKVANGVKGDAVNCLQNVPIYSVGPATTRALRAIQAEPPLQIFGEHTGNGEALAAYILEHYHGWYSDREDLPPLLFLVGEQRRDIIPKTLMDQSLAHDRRILVDEEVVYGTGVMETFPRDFEAILYETRHEPERWIVVFSPTGCDDMLQGLGLLNQHGDRVDLQRRDGKSYIATIGPTTRAHLMDQFGFEPDVCADSPSPDGILDGIVKFTMRHT